MTDFKVHCSIFFTLQSTTSKQQPTSSIQNFPVLTVLVQFIQSLMLAWGYTYTQSHRSYISGANDTYIRTGMYACMHKSRQAGSEIRQIYNNGTYVCMAARSRHFPYSLNCAVCSYIKQMLMVDNSTFHYRRSVEKQD